MGKGLRKDNKGFSLVELIIVIAIMAILVGVMAPQLIKYIEKANVSADVQMLDSIHTAITLAMMDPDVLMATDNTQTQLGHLMSPGSKWLTSVGGNTTFCLAVRDILGWNPFLSTEQNKHMRSTPARDMGQIMFEPMEGGSGFVLWIVHSDVTGGKQNNAATTLAGLTDEITNNGH